MHWRLHILVYEVSCVHKYSSQDLTLIKGGFQFSALFLDDPFGMSAVLLCKLINSFCLDDDLGTNIIDVSSLVAHFNLHF